MFVSDGCGGSRADMVCGRAERAIVSVKSVMHATPCSGRNVRQREYPAGQTWASSRREFPSLRGITAA